MTFPKFNVESLALLHRHNERWRAYYDNWQRHAAAPWWERHLVITPELRASYEKWLPIEEFVRGISAIGRAWLPEAACLPLPLRKPMYLSLPDLWAAMPPILGKKVCFSEAELLQLFCALADPPKFGTICGRYAEELEVLRQLRRDGMRILDVACGVGLNTMEIADATNAETIGITSEWLEVWMANNRALPHDAKRQHDMSGFPEDLNVKFYLGNAEAFSLERPVDVIVCNGLVGGRFFHSRRQYEGFLASCRKCLVNGGTILLANHFHSGTDFGLDAFAKQARNSGFSVNGNRRLLVLKG